ncbi:hypothetical protein ASG31_10725 [Chryseobacterium sp. Leaf404]|nr:hypothetical protein ASG31_10725 [Chryseobacterium sp. Leaf404]
MKSLSLFKFHQNQFPRSFLLQTHDEWEFIVKVLLSLNNGFLLSGEVYLVKFHQLQLFQNLKINDRKFCYKKGRQIILPALVFKVNLLNVIF